MVNYTKRELNLLALLIALLIVIICNLLIFPIKNFNSTNYYYKQVYSKTIPISKINTMISTKTLDSVLSIEQFSYKQVNSEQEISNKANNQENTIETVPKNITQRQLINENKTNKWRIQIPKINLDVHIMEGTTSEVLLKAVGHFKETSKWKGNVGLAAHNRGYNCNFFQKIKNLQIGDEIIYYTNNGKKVYKVQTNKVILDTDWSYLEQTNDNRITLITCEENRKDYRRCIQAVEVNNYKI
ncbi:MAG: class D sortase [Clostridia bacterium]